MRRLTIEIEPNEDIKKHQKPIFENINSYEILETLKVDSKQGICIDLIECYLKEHILIDELKTIGMMEILNVIRSEGSKHLILTKYYE